jgi:hypothetical protein
MSRDEADRVPHGDRAERHRLAILDGSREYGFTPGA